jgi:uncharacterized membrane protein
VRHAGLCGAGFTRGAPPVPGTAPGGVQRRGGQKAENKNLTFMINIYVLFFMKMIPLNVLTWFLFFSAMSFAGWIIETIYRSCAEKKFVNAGFLSGPFLPIYGFGALIITTVSIVARKFPSIISWAIILLSPTVLEYFGSWMMEKLFKLKLWDYTRESLNIHGRICFKFSIIWAFFAVVHIHVIQPYVLQRITGLGPYYAHFIAGGLTACFALDLNHSVRSIIHFKDFQINIAKLIEKGRNFTPAFDFHLESEKGGKLPHEIRRLLKPLNAFPHLRKGFREKSFVFPRWINEILEKRFKK